MADSEEPKQKESQPATLIRVEAKAVAGSPSQLDATEPPIAPKPEGTPFVGQPFWDPPASPTHGIPQARESLSGGGDTGITKNGGSLGKRWHSFIVFGSFVIALVSAVFSWWQWQTAEQDARRAAAIDISSKYLYGDIADLRHGYSNYHEAKGETDQANADKANAFIWYLDYVAKLINNGSVDESFISTVVRCQTQSTYHEVYIEGNLALQKRLPSRSDIPDLVRLYETQHQIGCPSSFKQPPPTGPGQ